MNQREKMIEMRDDFMKAFYGTAKEWALSENVKKRQVADLIIVHSNILLDKAYAEDRFTQEMTERETIPGHDFVMKTTAENIASLII